jgi:cell wall integrity and stress response component
MVTTILRAAVAAAALLAASVIADPAPNPVAHPQDIPSPTATFKMNALIKVGCFSTAAPMTDHGPYTFQSSGNCQGVCYGLQMPVMGVVNGTNCWCGSLIPPNATQVDIGQCNTPCAGIDTELCKAQQ